eukprot:jgi/Ulvmu1/745/UM010_0118.1
MAGQVTTCTIGYPRIGPDREMKKALEKFWKGGIEEAEFVKIANDVQDSAWKMQKAAGVALVGLDGTHYDQVLDTSLALGLAPPRFQHLQGLKQYFAIARGVEGAPAQDMSKFLNTNYHYLVPEISAATKPAANPAAFLDKVKRGQAAVGKESAVPMLIGPVTLAQLATLEGLSVSECVQRTLPAYSQLLAEVKKLGVPEIQLHEPALCMSQAVEDKVVYEGAYKAIAGCGLPINLVTYYDDIAETYSWVVTLPVAAISLDFVGQVGSVQHNRTLEVITKHGFPADKRLGAGVISGRGVWVDEDDRAAGTLGELRAVFKGSIAVQSSCTMQHVPMDLDRETKLAPELKKRLAFAKQKLVEIVTVAKQLSSGKCPAKAPTQVFGTAGQMMQKYDKKMFDRPLPYEERRQAQFKAFPAIPAFPTSTIGSFPQTTEIRAARAAFKAGRIDDAEYKRRVDTYITHCIGVQEGLGIDVLVHGEPERTDMVEFFGQCMEGMAFTQHGWVQSYGSRYVRPPIVHGTIKRTSPMTIREFVVAQGLTSRPVKGMLTGPITIMNWSFGREDVPRAQSVLELGAAIREEVADLEAAGCTAIQVDDPALREGMPLKQEAWQPYLDTAVAAFRMACGVAKPETQMWTHFCYSDFDDIMPAIEAMDADVLTIENSRSGNAMLHALADGGYKRDVGPGVYDVHSPLVPPASALSKLLEGFVSTNVHNNDPRRLWVVPDCGLKTRGWPEVLAALRSMVSAAETMRVQAAAA